MNETRVNHLKKRRLKYYGFIFLMFLGLGLFVFSINNYFGNKNNALAKSNNISKSDQQAIASLDTIIDGSKTLSKQELPYLNGSDKSGDEIIYHHNKVVVAKLQEDTELQPSGKAVRSIRYRVYNLSVKNLSVNYLYTNIIGQNYRNQQHLQKFLAIRQQNLRGFGPDGSINDLQHSNVTALKQLPGKSETDLIVRKLIDYKEGDF